MNLPKETVEVLKILRSSKLFQPINILPKNQLDGSSKTTLMPKSQKLMIDLGIIRHSSNGIYHLLPLGVRTMNKLKSLVRKYLSEIEAQEVKMPLIIDGSIWKLSGRWDEISEIFKVKDKHGCDYILSPTNEESVTDLVANLGVISHRQLPLILYQIAPKFRDEIKPRCGLLKSKEFEMMDAYSFDECIDSAKHTYGSISSIFDKIFNHLQLPFIKALADPGTMGGEISHEYHLNSHVGEDTVNVCDNCGQAVNSEYIPNACLSCGGTSLKKTIGIEVGHTFLLGTRYSSPFKCYFKDVDGNSQPFIMSCYGLGLSRLLSASLEVLSSDEEIRWPFGLAPFSVCVIPPKSGSNEWETGSNLSLDIYKELNKILPEDVLLDDRSDQTIGRRLRYAKKTGYPYIICVGKRALESPPLFELICTSNNLTQYFTLSELMKYFETFHQKEAQKRYVS